jgi:hypothetical protein
VTLSLPAVSHSLHTASLTGTVTPCDVTGSNAALACQGEGSNAWIAYSASGKADTAVIADCPWTWFGEVAKSWFPSHNSRDGDDALMACTELSTCGCCMVVVCSVRLTRSFGLLLCFLLSVCMLPSCDSLRRFVTQRAHREEAMLFADLQRLLYSGIRPRTPAKLTN